jgi:hypothetical protein
VELLECLADLLVETARRKDAIERIADGDDPRVRLNVSREAAGVHQMLEHLRLV